MGCGAGSVVCVFGGDEVHIMQCRCVLCVPGGDEAQHIGFVAVRLVLMSRVRSAAKHARPS